MKTVVQTEGIKTIPAVSGAVVYNLTLNELVAMATLIYILLQAAYLIWKWIREIQS